METVKLKPVPESPTEAGWATEPELTVRVPAAVPPRVGVKTSEAVQLSPAAKPLEQVFWAMLKGAGAESVNASMAMPVELVIVTDCAGLVVPGVTREKLS